MKQGKGKALDLYLMIYRCAAAVAAAAKMPHTASTVQPRHAGTTSMS